MLRNKLVILVVGLLLIAVVIYNLYFFMGKKSGATPRQQPVGVAQTAGQGKADGQLMALPSPVSRDRESWKRDPFMYAGKYADQRIGENSGVAKDTGKKKTSSLKLEGIIVRGGKRFALVNGWVVEAGDRIDDVLITRVTRYSIIVKDAGGLREISLYNDILDKEK